MNFQRQYFLAGAFYCRIGALSTLVSHAHERIQQQGRSVRFSQGTLCATCGDWRDTFSQLRSRSHLQADVANEHAVALIRKPFQEKANAIRVKMQDTEVSAGLVCTPCYCNFISRPAAQNEMIEDSKARAMLKAKIEAQTQVASPIPGPQPALASNAIPSRFLNSLFLPSSSIVWGESLGGIIMDLPQDEFTNPPSPRMKP